VASHHFDKFCSGMKAKDTITAEMAFMFGERNDGESTIDYPMEGSKAIVEALLRGIKKFGGQVLLSSPVEEIVVEGTFPPYCGEQSLLRFIR
jgi:phytoene dehydrogenase-like protein